jgi:ribosomal protein S18 acetylase RimI-like enzyme
VALESVRNPMSQSSSFSESLPAPSNPRISLRAVSPEDKGFLLKLYASTRQAEMASWGWSAVQQEAFLQMQFSARERSYEAAYSGAQRRIILLGNDPAGAMIVFQDQTEIRLVDISLLPEHRGRGVGATLIGELIAEAASASVPLRLSVLRGNRAVGLYERLGFVPTGEDEMYLQMERKPF